MHQPGWAVPVAVSSTRAAARREGARRHRHGLADVTLIMVAAHGSSVHPMQPYGNGLRGCPSLAAIYAIQVWPAMAMAPMRNQWVDGDDRPICALASATRFRHIIQIYASWVPGTLRFGNQSGLAATLSALGRPDYRRDFDFSAWPA